VLQVVMAVSGRGITAATFDRDKFAAVVAALLRVPVATVRVTKVEDAPVQSAQRRLGADADSTSTGVNVWFSITTTTNEVRPSPGTALLS
jgi:hypothetical protein